MNLKEEKYAKYYLVQEMMGTVPTVAKFNPDCSKFVADSVRKTGRIFFSGEGSSRLLPAKNCRRVALTWGLAAEFQNDGSHQAADYDLSRYTVLIDSNSGRTKEALLLAKKLQAEGHKDTFALSANPDTPIRQATYRNAEEMTAAIGTLDENSFVRQIRSETETNLHRLEELRLRI